MYQFFSYYGAKMRASVRYPAPSCDVIVEPFAGSAGYSTRHHAKKVLLRDTYKPVVDLWRFLISATYDDVMSLPIIEPGESLSGRGLDDGSMALIGFWCHRASSTPRDKLSSWSTKWRTRFWSPEVRQKIASQVHLISHWECELGSWEHSPDIRATWFVDPPYVTGGHYYAHGSRDIDYATLGDWCRSRRGQTIACEQGSASWLPFEHAYVHKGIRREERSELVWLSSRD